jgi:hypothetical protein
MLEGRGPVEFYYVLPCEGKWLINKQCLALLLIATDILLIVISLDKWKETLLEIQFKSWVKGGFYVYFVSNSCK